MPDVRSFYDDKWVRAWDLAGRDVTVVIAKVEQGLLENPQKRQSDRKPVVWFKGAKKPLALNKTNMKTIAGLYGYEVNKWIGQRITLYPTRTTLGGEEIDCIRVRPSIPQGQAQDMPMREPGDDSDQGAIK